MSKPTTVALFVNGPLAGQYRSNLGTTGRPLELYQYRIADVSSSSWHVYLYNGQVFNYLGPAPRLAKSVDDAHYLCEP